MASIVEISPLSKEIVSCEVGVNGRMTDGHTCGWTTWKHNASATYCWRRHKSALIIVHMSVVLFMQM